MAAGYRDCAPHIARFQEIGALGGGYAMPHQEEEGMPTPDPRHPDGPVIAWTAATLVLGLALLLALLPLMIGANA